jgi:GxxExxY protein
MKEEDVLAKRVLDEAFRLHTELGPGLLESVYEQVLASRLRKAGLQVETQKTIPIVVDDLTIPDAFRADLVVGGKLIVELKSVEEMKPVFAKQLLTSLRPETRPAPEFRRTQPQKRHRARRQQPLTPLRTWRTLREKNLNL